MTETPQIGVLCLQGDYEAHGRVLDRLGVAWRDVRRPDALEGLHGLILPGGESTTMWHFLRQDDFAAAIQSLAGDGAAIYGTCAGAILMARAVRNPNGEGMGLLDVDVERNSYGAQIASAIREATLEDVEGLEVDGAAGASGASSTESGARIEAVLIRAPRIVRVGPGVRVRARQAGDPVWVESGRCMATTFHPELGTLELPHRRFIALARDAAHRLRNCSQSLRNRLS
jgi:5'-phosphate synthase pdxT subunit